MTRNDYQVHACIPLRMIWFFCKRIDFDIPSEFFDSISAEGAVAQLEERVVRNDEVGGSIPLGSTIFQSHATVQIAQRINSRKGKRIS